MLAGRFRAEILKTLEAGEAHFGALRGAIGASAHTLTRQLRVLEAAGLLAHRDTVRWGPRLHPDRRRARHRGRARPAGRR